jgi:hypothetical protein
LDTTSILLIFLSYVTFNFVGMIAGIVMILNKGVLRELGIAIVVGSIFAFGSFIAQWWSIEVQQEIDFVGRVSGREAYQQHLGEMRNEIIEILDGLSSPDNRYRRPDPASRPGRLTRPRRRPAIPTRRHRT